MNYEDLNKEEIIKSTVKYLMDKFGQDKFRIQDNWDGDLTAIGLTDNSGKYLIYFSNNGQNSNDFYVSLENLTSENERPYEPV